MDSKILYSEIYNKEKLKKAYEFALNDRYYSDFFCNFIEIEYAIKFKDKIIEELYEELKGLRYKTQTAFSYFPQKNKNCYRRMIHIQFKDLIVRYSFAITLSDYLDKEMLEVCFANRRDKNEYNLTEKFSNISWPNFCNWQEEKAKRYRILLKTDITAFYDSISHDYLIKIILKELSQKEDTDFIKTFKKILRLNVITPYEIGEKNFEEDEIRQGLATGNFTEGIFANIYLNDIDKKINSIEGIEYGRYVDDIRIFSNDKQKLSKAILLLQKQLLKRGLNLNAKKTEIAENKAEIENLKSRIDNVNLYVEIESEINNKIDKHLYKFDRVFKKEHELVSQKDAKEYCKFVSSILKKDERDKVVIDKIYEIIIKWSGAAKHAIWLLIETANGGTFDEKVKEYAKEVIIKVLINDEICEYSKSRVLYHIVKPRNKIDGGCFYNIVNKEKIYEIIPELLKKKSYDLILMVLYYLRIQNKKNKEIEDYIYNNITLPIAEPIKNFLMYNKELEEIVDIVKEQLVNVTVGSFNL